MCVISRSEFIHGILSTGYISRGQHPCIPWVHVVHGISPHHIPTGYNVIYPVGIWCGLRLILWRLSRGQQVRLSSTGYHIPWTTTIPWTTCHIPWIHCTCYIPWMYTVDTWRYPVGVIYRGHTPWRTCHIPWIHCPYFIPWVYPVG